MWVKVDSLDLFVCVCLVVYVFVLVCLWVGWLFGCNDADFDFDVCGASPRNLGVLLFDAQLAHSRWLL